LETMVEKKLYEGMFLVDSADAASDWDGVNAVIKKILDKAEAEIVSIKKWDDRRLAYDIKGTSRGTYILCYFKAGGEKIQGIEKAVQLSEKIIRVLILSTEQMTKEDIEKDTPAIKAEKEKQKTTGELPQGDEASERSDIQEEDQIEEEIELTEEDEESEDSEQSEEAEQDEEP
jgi:small subunit ribosomal protein S6